MIGIILTVLYILSCFVLIMFVLLWRKFGGVWTARNSDGSRKDHHHRGDMFLHDRVPVFDSGVV